MGVGGVVSLLLLVDADAEGEKEQKQHQPRQRQRRHHRDELGRHQRVQRHLFLVKIQLDFR